MNSENYTAQADEKGFLSDRTVLCDHSLDVTLCLDEETDLTGDTFDVDPEAELRRMLEIQEHQISDFGKDPTKPHAGNGPAVFIGFDSEFVPGYKDKDESIDNTILSLQFYLVGERGTFQRVVYPSGDSEVVPFV